MKHLGALLVELAETLPEGAGGDSVGVGLRVTDVDLELPLEARLVRGATLEASLPRSLRVTGFDLPAARLRVSLVRREP